MECNFKGATEAYIGNSRVLRVFKDNEIIYSNEVRGIYKQSCPYRIMSDKERQKPYGTPEYNHHVLLFPLTTKDIEDVTLSYIASKPSWWFYSTIRCDDDCFCFVSDAGGSRFTASNTLGTIESNVGNSSFNLNHYYSNARYTIDGSYSSKIIHVPSNTNTFDVQLGKYRCLLAGIANDWDEIGRELGVVSYSEAAQEAAKNGDNTLQYIEQYITATDKHYYFFVANEKLLWYSTTFDTSTMTYSSTEMQKQLLLTQKIIESISATNTTSIQTLHFTASENTTDAIKYQCLLYLYDTDPSCYGYHPERWSTTLDGRTPRFIIVLDPKDSKLIYWGAEFVNTKFEYRTIIKTEYTSFRHDTTTLYVDFNGMNFATINTITNKLNSLLDISISVSSTTSNQSTLCYYFYVAIPEKYFKLYVPIFYNDSNDSDESNEQLTVSNSHKDLDGTEDGIKEVYFNSEKYYLYMVYLKGTTQIKANLLTYEEAVEISDIEQLGYSKIM